MNKPVFTRTEVKDWINDQIAENKRATTLTPDNSLYFERIEMFEYIRDNYLPDWEAFIECSSDNDKEESPSQNAIDYAKGKAQGYDTVEEKEEDI